MKIKHIRSLLVLSLTLVAQITQARTINFGSETEVVTITAGGTTLLKFPGEVRTISQAQRFEIQPADPEQPNYALLSVRPRFSTGSSRVTFILNDGTIIQTKLVIASTDNPEKTESIYEFKSKSSLIGETPNLPNAGLSELELMRAMIRNDTVPGYEIKQVSRAVSPGFRGVTVTLVEIYTGNQFNGYAFEIENKTKDKNLLINIQNLMLGEPNLALVSNVDSQVIKPFKDGKSKSILRIVAKATSIYSKLILPIETVEKKP